MYAGIRARRRRGAALAATAVFLVLVLGACETDPATNVTSTAASLNAKGKCIKGLKGWSRFQLRDASVGGGFNGVGDIYSYDCGNDTQVVQFEPRRIGGLAPGHAYEFRLRTEANGDAFWTDSVGTRGGTNYDWFVTPSNVQVETSESERWLSYDPETGEPIASAAGNCGAPKEMTNTRKGKADGLITLWTIELTTAWKYCNGQVTKMYRASPSCWTTAAGTIAGWRCVEKNKIRAYSQGGNPEHVVWTYEFIWRQTIPIKGGIDVNTIRWCASNYASGSGAKYMNGSCDLKPWGT